MRLSATRFMLTTWGEQRRRVLTGRTERQVWLFDGRKLHTHAVNHVDGWAEKSPAAALRDGGRSGKVEQHFAEVYTGDGLEVWRALEGAPELVRVALEWRYVGEAARIELTPTGWEAISGLVSRGVHYVAGRFRAMAGWQVPAALLAENASAKARAKALGISRATYFRRMAREPDSVAAYIAAWRAGSKK